MHRHHPLNVTNSSFFEANPIRVEKSIKIQYALENLYHYIDKMECVNSKVMKLSESYDSLNSRISLD